MLKELDHDPPPGTIHPNLPSPRSNGRGDVAGSDSEGEVRVVELPEHPFSIGTLYVPQTRSSEGRPHPLVTAFIQAVLEKSAHLSSNRL